MGTAFVIAMLGVAISLGVVVIGVRANEAKKRATKDGGDAETTTYGDSGTSDCGPSDGGGCDGGGGGD